MFLAASVSDFLGALFLFTSVSLLKKGILRNLPKKANSLIGGIFIGENEELNLGS